MYRLQLLLALGLFIIASLAFWPPAATSADEKPVDLDEQFLRDNKIATDDASLLAFVRKRADHDTDLLNLKGLIRQLGDANADRRDEASAKLAAIGLAALPALRDAAKSTDPEIARRAQVAVEEAAKETTWALPGAAIHLLLRRKPAGTAEALLAYLPYVSTDEATEEDIWFGLYEMAKRDPQLSPLFRTALKDRFASRRALAGCVLGRLGGVEDQAAVRKLLNDTEPTVRLRAAQGLLAGKDTAGIPTLIALLEEPDVAVSWQAEELLHYVGGHQSPSEVVGAASAVERTRCRKAWEGWWQRQTTLDFAALDRGPLRPGLVFLAENVKYERKRRENPLEEKYEIACDVCQAGCDARPRWRITDLPISVTSVHLGGGNRVYCNANEFDLKGQAQRKRREAILQIGQGRIERLPNGNFIHVSWDWESGHQVTAYTPEGNTAYSLYFRSAPDLSVQPAGELVPRFLYAIQSVDRRPTGRFLTVERELATGRVFVRQRDGRTGQLIPDSQWEPPLEPGLCFEWKRIRDGHFLVVALPRENSLAIHYPALRPLFAAVDMAKPDPEKRPALSPGLWELDKAGKRFRTLNPSLERLSQFPNGEWLCRDPEAVCQVDAKERKTWEVISDHHPRATPCLGLVRMGFDQPLGNEWDLCSPTVQMRKLQDESPTIRKYYVKRLWPRKPAEEDAVIQALIKVLTADPDTRITEIAAQKLQELGPKAIPSLAKLLKHPDRQVRFCAVIAMQSKCPETEASLPLLIGSLKDEDALIRQSAAQILGIHCKDSKEIIKALTEALPDPEPQVQRYVIGALKEQKSEAKEAIPALLTILNDHNSEVRNDAAWAIGAIAPEHQRVIPALIQTLTDTDERAQYGAMGALKKLGPRAKAAVPALKLLLKDKTAHLRDDVPGTLVAIAPEDAELVPALIAVLKDPSDQSMRLPVVTALGQLGPRAKPALPVLKALLIDKDEAFQDAVARVVRHITGEMDN